MYLTLIGVVLAISKRCNARSCATNWKLLTTSAGHRTEAPAQTETKSRRGQPVSSASPEPKHDLCGTWSKKPRGSSSRMGLRRLPGTRKKCSCMTICSSEIVKQMKQQSMQFLRLSQFIAWAVVIATNTWNARLSGHPRDKAMPG